MEDDLERRNWYRVAISPWTDRQTRWRAWKLILVIELFAAVGVAITSFLVLTLLADSTLAIVIFASIVLIGVATIAYIATGRSGQHPR